MNARRFLLLILLLLCAAVGRAGFEADRKPPGPPPHPADVDQAAGEPNDAPPIFKAPAEEVPVLRFGEAGKGPEKMTKVTLVTVDPQGFVYLGDTDAGRAMRFTPEGKLESLFSIENPQGPWTGLAADRAGIVYVVSGGRLFRYEGSGKLLGEVKHPDGAGFFHVAPRPDSGVIASWRNAQRDDFVLVGRDGTIETIHRNAVTGAAGEPAGDVLVAMDGRRTIYAAVNHLHALCVFKFTGEYVNRFGSDGEEPGQFSGPLTGLTADGQGQIFVSDAGGIEVFLSKEAQFFRRLAVKGTGLAISDDDELVVAQGPGAAKYQPETPPKED